VQIDGLETSGPDNNNKKKKGPAVTVDSTNKLEKHHFHLNALEKVLRLWENESLSKEDVRALSFLVFGRNSNSWPVD